MFIVQRIQIVHTKMVHEDYSSFYNHGAYSSSEHNAHVWEETFNWIFSLAEHLKTTKWKKNLLLHTCAVRSQLPFKTSAMTPIWLQSRFSKEEWEERESFLLQSPALARLTWNAVCPRSSDPFYIVAYYIKWVTTSWTRSIYTKIIMFQI